MTSEPVAPELTLKNCVTRFILVPKHTFGGTGNVGGWVGKIVRVSPAKDPTLFIKLLDADGTKMHYFALSKAQADFKTLS